MADRYHVLFTGANGQGSVGPWSNRADAIEAMHVSARQRKSRGEMWTWQGDHYLSRLKEKMEVVER